MALHHKPPVDRLAASSPSNAPMGMRGYYLPQQTSLAAFVRATVARQQQTANTSSVAIGEYSILNSFDLNLRQTLMSSFVLKFFMSTLTFE